jgi:hypothetical protein
VISRIALLGVVSAMAVTALCAVARPAMPIATMAAANAVSLRGIVMIVPRARLRLGGQVVVRITLMPPATVQNADSLAIRPV